MTRNGTLFDSSMLAPSGTRTLTEYHPGLSSTSDGTHVTRVVSVAAFG